MNLDTLNALLPAKYTALGVAILALLRAIDGLARLVPDKYLAAHTTTQAVIEVARKLLGKAPPAALLFLLFLPSCGHAVQAARGTFATLAAAEHSYAKWATTEVERLVAKAKADCPKAPDRAACVERLTGPTFRNLEITDAALVSYHEAQRAASICLAKGGDVLACTTASAGAAGKLLEQLDAVGFKVLQ